MKMRIVKVGADRFDQRNIGFYVMLEGASPADFERLGAMVDVDVEVDIRRTDDIDLRRAAVLTEDSVVSFHHADARG